MLTVVSIHYSYPYNIDDKADRPTLIECVRFRGRERRINITQEIGTKYHNFGLFLLEDDTGARIHSLAHKHRDDAEQINIEVLRQWITGRGKHPVTWKTLTEVLHDVEHHTLAGEIEAVKCHTDIPTEPSDNPLQKGLQDIPAEESEQKSTEHTPPGVPGGEKQCKTSDELQVDIDLLAADLLDRYYEKKENRNTSTSHRFGGDSSQSLKNKTAEVSKDSGHRSSGDTPACGIQADRYYEVIQEITDIASELPSRCSDLFKAFEQKDKRSSLHRVSNLPPFQKSRRDTTVVVTVGSEEGDIPESGFQHNLQQIVDLAADKLSNCFQLESLKLEGKESQRHSTTSDDPSTISDMTAEGSELRNEDTFDTEHTVKQTADVAADLLSRCFELLDFEASNKESKRNSVPNSVSEDSPVLSSLAIEVVKGSERGSIGNVPASCTDSTEDAKRYEALQHIADLAADVLHRCFVLLDFLALQKKQNGVPHEIGDRQLSSQMRS